MSDLIERQAAQTELMMKCERYKLARESHGMGHVEWSSDLISVADAMDAIRGLPSAQPERKKGKWIPQDHNKTNGMISTAVYYFPKCSVCGHYGDYTNFCPNCGSYNGGK